MATRRPLVIVNGVTSELPSGDTTPTNSVAPGTARQLLQTNAGGTATEWTSNVDVPGTLDVTSTATFDSIAQYPAGSAGAPTITFTGDTNTGIYSPGADQVAISTGGSGRLFVDASGRIGIGASSPGVPLDITTVNATANLRITDSTNGAKIKLVAASTELDLFNTGGAGWLGTATNSPLLLATNGTEKLRITSAGLVGVGTSSVDRLFIASDSADNNLPCAVITKAVTGGANSGLQVHTAGTDAGAGAYCFRVTAGNTYGSPTSEYLRVTAAGNVGIGTTSPRYNLSIGSTAITSTASPDTIDLGGTFSNTAGSNLKLRLYWDGTTAQGFGISAFQMDYVAASNAAHVFYRGASEAVRIDASSRLLVGTSSARSNDLFGTSQSQVEGTDSATSSISIIRNAATTGAGGIALCKSRSSSIGGVTVVQSGDVLGFIDFQGADGTDFARAATIEAQVDGTPGNNDMPGRLVFSTTADGASSPTERMRIRSDGGLVYGTGATPGNDIGSGTGFWFSTSSGLFYIRSVSSPVAAFNRGTDDGTLVEFKQDQTTEGTISVSGTTVSYNGAHLSRWSQLPSGAERSEILRGSVLSNIDEMCEWGDEENEQLNRMKVSDVEGDKNVSGVFQAWDDDDDTYTNDFYCAMTGDFIIRIGAGVTVERGDLLMSAGDGTAKPQDDDIIRSKTIAKVTSTNVSCTYDDGSYCVPCVLMAC